MSEISIRSEGIVFENVMYIFGSQTWKMNIATIIRKNHYGPHKTRWTLFEACDDIITDRTLFL